jgi:branched-chain amino acid aminotransferase
LIAKGEIVSFAQSKWVWMNGSVIPWENATTHVSSHALHYGTGVFEGIRCYETPIGPAVFRLDAHLDRLFASAETCGIPIPFTASELVEAVCQVIRQNGFRDCYIRPICYYGSGVLGLNPRACPVEVAILAWPWETYLGAEGLERGVSITVSPWRKFHSSMMPTRAKACGQYINSVLALREAVDRGFAEALLLDAAGQLAEGSGENLFLVHDDRVITNDENNSILPGITRDSILRIARDLGFGVEVRALSLTELLAADEAFFTGTAAEVTPISDVDGTMIGGGTRGPVTHQIQQAFFAVVQGRDASHAEWLHPVLAQSVAEPAATENVVAVLDS